MGKLPPPASDANELRVPRLHGEHAVGLHGSLGNNERSVRGFEGRWVAGGPAAEAERLGWKVGRGRRREGLRSGTQSLALRRQQMAAEQPGRRETLIVRSEWLSVGGWKREKTARAWHPCMSLLKGTAESMGSGAMIKLEVR